MDQRCQNVGSRTVASRLPSNPACGGTGIGYFVWNEWSNLSLTSAIFAILMIGVASMILDMAFARLQKAVTCQVPPRHAPRSAVLPDPPTPRGFFGASFQKIRGGSTAGELAATRGFPKAA